MSHDFDVFMVVHLYSCKRYLLFCLLTKPSPVCFFNKKLNYGPKPRLRLRPKPRLGLRPKPRLRFRPKPRLRLRPKPRLRLRPKPRLRL